MNFQKTINTFNSHYKSMQSLLSDLERNRLVKRKTEKDSKIKTTNDMRVRRKVAEWFAQLDDVILASRYLPDDQFESLFTDSHILRLLNLAAGMMHVKRYLPIIGNPGKPETWEVKINNFERRPALDIDIARAGHLDNVTDFIRSVQLGIDTPISKATLIHNLEASNFIEDIRKLPEDYLTAYKRVSEATINAAEEMGLGDLYKKERGKKHSKL